MNTSRLSLNFLLLFTLQLASCSMLPSEQGFQANPTSTVFPTNVPMDIVCTLAFRSTVSIPIETQTSVILSKENQNAEVPFKDLMFHAMYFYGTPYELRFLKLWVTTKDSEKEISSVLYQLSRSNKLVNQIEEHGFTGLNYIYNPTSRSELQFWCKAE